MKNKLFLSEDEKSRILGLHKTRIHEELAESDPTSVGGWTALGAGTGAALGTVVPGVGNVVGAVVGTIAGAALGYVLTSGGKSYDKVKKTMSFCKTHKKSFGKPTKTDARLRELATDIRDALSVFGWTNLNDLRRALQSCETVVDFCGVAEKYDRMYGESLFNAIHGDIDSESEWLNYVWLPIEKLIKKTPKIEENKPKPPKDDTELRVNAAKCGWGDDVEGYRKSGWKCPKGGNSGTSDDPTPVRRKRRGGTRYTFNYDEVMKKLNEKCGTSGTQDDKEEKPLNWRGDQPNATTQQVDPNLGKSTFDSMTAD